jgi:hypothetical protein
MGAGNVAWRRPLCGANALRQTRDAEHEMNPGTSSPLNRLPVRSEADMIAVLEGLRQALLALKRY